VYGQAVSTDEYELRHIQQRRGDYETELQCKRWAAVENPENNSVIALITSWQSANIEIMDSGREGAHLFAGTGFGLKPNETKEYVTWLVLCESVEQAQKYMALSEVWELP